MTPTPALSPRAFLTDFGLAKSVATGSKLTRTGEALGTPAYMSPEQARGEVWALTPATDVWSLGCVLYEILAGRAPFEGETTAAVVAGILTRDARRLRAVRGDVPEPVERVVRVCLARRARERYADAAALGVDLARLLGGERPRARLPGRRRRALLAAAAGAIGLSAASGAWLASDGGSAPSGSPEVAVPHRSEADTLARWARDRRATEPAESARLLAEAVRLEPGRHDLRLERGLVLWAVGEEDRALAEWARIPPAAPEAPGARLAAGLLAFVRCVQERRPPDSARPLLDEAVSLGGREGRIAAAALHAAARRWEEARPLLREEPGWEAAMLRGYVEHWDPSGSREEAARAFAGALQGGVPLAWVHVNRGLALQALADHRGALAEYEAALRLRPELPEALNNRGNARAELGDGEGALEDYDAAVRARPDYPEARVNRGLTRFQRGDFAGAVEDLDAALRLDPDHAFARYNRGLARQKLGDLPGALEDYDGTLHRRPDFVEALVNRGNIRVLQAEPQRALEDYNRALALRPGFPHALLNRARTRRGLGDTDGAVADLRLALETADPAGPVWSDVAAELESIRAERQARRSE